MTALAGCAKSDDEITDGSNNGGGEPKTYTVTFNSNGGSAIDAQTVKEGDKASKPNSSPTKVDYFFGGWYKDNNTFSYKWDFSFDPVYADITLYAKWVYFDEINGARWAGSNVNAVGTFAANAESPGMFYQWNRKKAWPATGDVNDWDATTPSGDIWEAANDPCPSGWRLPTRMEQTSLCDTTNVTNEWTTLNSVEGRRFTDKVSGATIFLPIVGRRFYSNGVLSSEPIEVGYYWSNSSYSVDLAWGVHFANDITAEGNFQRAGGYSIRCVRQ